MLEMTGEIIDTLKELQALDTRLKQTRGKSSALSHRIDEQKKKVAALQAERENLAKELRDQEKRLGMKELEVKSVQEKVNKLRTQLNITSSNKEYQAMLKEIGEFEADKSRREDAELALMDGIEQTKTRIARIAEEIGSAQGKVQAEETSVAADVANLKAQVAELEKERADLASRLDRNVLDKYERILASRNGLAVAAVIGGSCQGCNMGVTRQMESRLWSKKELLFCPNCSRILYLEGDAS